MVTVHVLHNIGVNKSVSESITKNSHRVNGKFIISIIGKKWFITSLYTYSFKEQVPLNKY